MGRLVILLDLVGLTLLVAAAWLFSPILGLAIAGGACLLSAAAVERIRR